MSSDGNNKGVIREHVASLLPFKVVETAENESGSAGVLVKELSDPVNSPFLARYKLEKHNILRVATMVNRRSVDAFGKALIEKQGKRWVFTDFGFEIWGKTKKDLDVHDGGSSNCFEEDSEVGVN